MIRAVCRIPLRVETRHANLYGAGLEKGVGRDIHSSDMDLRPLSEISCRYHCISRRVRRPWLCGIDPDNGKSYEHRREWVEGRLLELADIFAVGLHAYAVTSNHVHVVVRIDPNSAFILFGSHNAGVGCSRRPSTVKSIPPHARSRNKTCLCRINFGGVLHQLAELPSWTVFS